MSANTSQAIAALCLLVVAACTTTNCNPAQANLLESLQCEAGGFQVRQAALQNSLAQTQADELQQQARASQARQAAVGAQADLAQRRKRLTNLDAQLATLKQRLKQAALDRNVNQEALRQARSEMDDLERHRAQVNTPDPDAQHLDTLAARESNVLEILRSME